MTDPSPSPSHTDLERAEGHASFSDAVIRGIQDVLGIDHDADPVEALRARLQLPAVDRPVPEDELDRLDAFARRFGSVALSGRTARSLIDEVRAARAAIPPSEEREFSVRTVRTRNVHFPMPEEDARRRADGRVYELVSRRRTDPWVSDSGTPSGQTQTPATAEPTA